MNRRNLLVTLAASLATSACSNNVTVKTIGSIFDSSFGKGAAFDPDYPDKLPYASISVSQNGLKRSLLVLGKVEGDELHWISADRGVLITRHGRLVRTVGFAENLAKTDFSGEDFVTGKVFPNLENQLTAARIVDLSPGNRYGIKIESSLEMIGKESIAIGSHRHETTRIDEHCVAPLLRWKYTNSFWLDAQGQVWRSTQHFAPTAPVMSIEVTKPYRAS